jgi:hypothetical protein
MLINYANDQKIAFMARRCDALKKFKPSSAANTLILAQVADFD